MGIVRFEGMVTLVSSNGAVIGLSISLNLDVHGPHLGTGKNKL